MPDSGDVQLEARVTRYRIARLRLAQGLLPLGMIASIAARRVPEVVPPIAAFAVLGAIVVVFASAIKSLGWQPLRFEDSALFFGSTGLSAAKFGVREWTFVGGTARLYGADTSFKVRARPGGAVALEALLAGVFGRPTRLKRRGSDRARTIALVVAALGLVAAAAAFYTEVLALMFVGVPAFIFGLATFGALSQRMRA
jgi:hypothetical protein